MNIYANAFIGFILPRSPNFLFAILQISQWVPKPSEAFFLISLLLYERDKVMLGILFRTFDLEFAQVDC